MAGVGKIQPDTYLRQPDTYLTQEKLGRLNELVYNKDFKTVSVTQWPLVVDTVCALPQFMGGRDDAHHEAISR